MKKFILLLSRNKYGIQPAQALHKMANFIFKLASSLALHGSRMCSRICALIFRQTQYIILFSKILYLQPKLFFNFIVRIQSKGFNIIKPLLSTSNVSIIMLIYQRLFFFKIVNWFMRGRGYSMLNFVHRLVSRLTTQI